jgi:hypothetical protein
MFCSPADPEMGKTTDPWDSDGVIRQRLARVAVTKPFPSPHKPFHQILSRGAGVPFLLETDATSSTLLNNSEFTKKVLSCPLPLSGCMPTTHNLDRLRTSTDRLRRVITG